MVRAHFAASPAPRRRRRQFLIDILTLKAPDVITTSPAPATLTASALSPASTTPMNPTKVIRALLPIDICAPCPPCPTQPPRSLNTGISVMGVLVGAVLSIFVLQFLGFLSAWRGA